MPTAPYIRLDSSDPAGSGKGWIYPPASGGLVLCCDGPGQPAELHEGMSVVRRWDDPLDALAWMAANVSRNPPGQRWIGYLSYDLGRLFERLPNHADDNPRLPLFCFVRVGETGSSLLSPAPSERPPRLDGPRWNFTRRTYEAAVAKAIAYIAAGDVFQVNLSRRCTMGLRESVETVYERLLARTPATYGALLDFEDVALMCNSPELFLRVTPLPDGRRRVATRPIKGTRPRAPGMEAQLRASAKDQAELNMIVDLERNDLGRVCEIGSVKVTEPRAIEAHPTVYHGVATIEGDLRPEVTFVDLLRATFPGGSVTGAPKIRAMEIIEELEPVRRGPYCGAIGHLAADGTVEFNVAIRTMIVTADGLVHVPVGGGVVADSVPAAEFEETRVKARAMLEALGIDPGTA